jgi:hypothetical protein
MYLSTVAQVPSDVGMYGLLGELDQILRAELVLSKAAQRGFVRIVTAGLMNLSGTDTSAI